MHNDTHLFTGVIIAAPNLFVIETVDSQKLAESINKSCESLSKSICVMIQVNTSQEASKLAKQI